MTCMQNIKEKCLKMCVYRLKFVTSSFSGNVLMSEGTLTESHTNSSFHKLLSKNEKGKGKLHARTGHEFPGEEYRYSSALSLTSALDRVECSMPRPGRFTIWKETRYPFYRRLGGL